MPYLVCTGATLECSFGSRPAAFAASGVEVSAGSPAGVVTDFVPLANVPSFGMCSSLANPEVAKATADALGVLTPMPCVPLLSSPWLPGSTQVTIGEVSALDDSSSCQCTWAGLVTVEDAGQDFVSVQ